jgi:prepilin-type N-terminal cleavage/methylation domain-containing protein
MIVKSFISIGIITKKFLGKPNNFNSHNHFIHRNHLNQSSGFTLVELSLAIAIFATIAAGVAIPMVGSHLSSLEDRRTFLANTLLTESWEAIRSIRNRDWAGLADGDHGLSLEGGQWVLSGISDIQGGFTRVVTLTTPQRDAEGRLVEIGGTLDPDSKQVIINLSWQPPYSDPRTLVAESLIANYRSPGVWPIP